MADPPTGSAAYSPDFRLLILAVLALSPVGLVSSAYSYTAIFIGLSLYMLKDHPMLRQELLAERKYHWVVVAVAVSLLTDPNIATDLTLERLLADKRSWIVVALLFVLCHHSMAENDSFMVLFSALAIFIVAVPFLNGNDSDKIGTLLSKHLEGNEQTWAIIALVFVLYHYSAVRNAPPPTPASGSGAVPIVLLIVGYLLLGGHAALPLNFANSSHLQSLLLALGTYFSSPVTGPDYMPGYTELMLIPASWLVSSSIKATETLSEPYVQWILLAGITLVGVIFATTNVAGPFRYGYINRADLYKGFRGKIPSWAHFPLLWLAFHPWTGWFLLGGSACAAWQWVREHHREAAARVSSDADKADLRASSLAAWARDAAAAAERCELQVHDLATAVTRDTRSAYYVGLSDFYSEYVTSRAPQAKRNHAVTATDASDTAVGVTAFALGATRAARDARDAADSVHQLAIDAKGLAAVGNVGAALEVVVKLHEALGTCEARHNDAVAARESAQQKMSELHVEVVGITSRAKRSVATPTGDDDANEESEDEVVHD